MPTDHKQRVTPRLITMSLLLVLLPSLAVSANASQFESFDLNKDQTLNASEFVAAGYTIADFKSADADQNQKVSVAEYASFKTSLSKRQERKNSGPHPPHG